MKTFLYQVTFARLGRLSSTPTDACIQGKIYGPKMRMEPRAPLQDRANRGLWWHSSEGWVGTTTILLGTFSLPSLTSKLPPLWQVLKEKIDQLKLHGRDFNFAEHAPDSNKRTENRHHMDWPKEKYHWPVMFFLFLFSFIVCSFCIITMCWQKIDTFGDTWTNSSPGGK